MNLTLSLFKVNLSLFITLILFSCENHAQDTSLFLEGLTCYPSKPGVSILTLLQEQHNFCENGGNAPSPGESPFRLYCLEACIMSLWGLVYERDPESGEWLEDLEGIHTGHTQQLRTALEINFPPSVAETLARAVIQQCQYILKVIVGTIHVPCYRWRSAIYSCIEDAWACPR